ncbi:MAG: J domain-containing protein [Alphaproteobacteria bacterium]|jgi:hypothetical protein|nr:J domain-containing protein [Alphaproteobacteria bacterium]
MIKKCDFKGCTKAGICRAPKSRELKEYYWFCKEHAAEYNKNWNYYEGMTYDEVNQDWERETFGISDKDREIQAAKNTEYINFLRNFLNDRSMFDSAMHRPVRIPAVISNALKVFGLPPTTNWCEITAKYRVLAKKYHPDTAKNKNIATSEFTKITLAYDDLKKWFNK